jgi:hypothetical protein
MVSSGILRPGVLKRVTWRKIPEDTILHGRMFITYDLSMYCNILVDDLSMYSDIITEKAR